MSANSDLPTQKDLANEPPDVQAVVRGHKRIERNVTLLAALSFVVVAIGGAAASLRTRVV